MTNKTKTAESTVNSVETPLELNNVTPDYVKRRKTLFKMNLGIAITVFTLEIIIFIFLFTSDQIDIPLGEYLAVYMFLPAFLNFGTIGVEAFLLKKYPERVSLQSYMVVITLIVICTVVASVHYVFANTLTVFCIPILTSVVFGDKKLSVRAAIMSAVGFAIAVMCRLIQRISVGDSLIIPEGTISISVIGVSGLLAYIINSLISAQRSKLVAAMTEAKEAQAQAVLANQSKSIFLANMSHEIRTPINAILGMNEMILREEHDPKIREYAGNIESSGNALLSIINDVLDISKIESGKIEITCASYDISSLINDCHNMVAGRARSKNLELNVICDENLPRILSGDEAHIRQIIVNILTNAVKYTEKGGVTMSVGGEHSETGFTLKVTVRDTGIGISEENLPKVFGQFQRFDIERNRSIEGVGLGLSISKRLADLMGGNITLKSKVNEGSEFTIELPQTIVDNTPVGKISVNYSHYADYQYSHSFEAPDAHILAVDDVPVNLTIITNLLKDTRIKIDTASSGAMCLELAAKNKYDLILMDHMMPDMDGIETYEKLRDDKNSPNNSTPVIMLTANALAGMREQYMEEGFADYLSKPIRGAKLEEAIKKHLPQELVHTDIQENPEQTDESSEPSEFDRLTELLPQLNLKLALSYCCNSGELYMEILREYVGNGRYEEMEKAFAEERFDDYTRNAHSLKSTSRTIGLEGLSEKAAASEFALKNGNTDFARLNHQSLMEMYREVLDKLKEFLS